MAKNFILKSIAIAALVSTLSTGAKSAPVHWLSNITEVRSINMDRSAKDAMINIGRHDDDEFYKTNFAYLGKLSTERKVHKVNSWVNKAIAPVEDIEAFGVADKWSMPSETLRTRKGDCEDYALLKMKLLAQLGVPLDDMFILIAEDRGRGYHAVLLVNVDGEIRLLDNRTNNTLLVNRTMSQARYALGVRRSYKFQQAPSAFDRHATA